MKLKKQTVKNNQKKYEDDDDLNPNSLFCTTSKELLLKIANGEINAKDYAKLQLCFEGLDNKGKWIGFDKAEKFWGFK